MVAAEPVMVTKPPMVGVDVMDGTPEPSVFNIPLVAVARPAIVLVADEYSSWLAVVEASPVPPDVTGRGFVKLNTEAELIVAAKLFPCT